MPYFCPSCAVPKTSSPILCESCESRCRRFAEKTCAYISFFHGFSYGCKHLAYRMHVRCNMLFRMRPHAVKRSGSKKSSIKQFLNEQGFERQRVFILKREVRKRSDPSNRYRHIMFCAFLFPSCLYRTPDCH